MFNSGIHRKLPLGLLSLIVWSGKAFRTILLAVMDKMQGTETSEFQMQFQGTEENGEPATVRLEDSLQRTEMNMGLFLISETDGSPASNKHILSPMHQLSRANIEFLAGGSRSTLIYRRLQRPSAQEKKKKRGMMQCENLSSFAWLFLSLALLQSKYYRHTHASYMRTD